MWRRVVYSIFGQIAILCVLLLVAAYLDHARTAVLPADAAAIGRVHPSSGITHTAEGYSLRYYPIYRTPGALLNAIERAYRPRSGWRRMTLQRDDLVFDCDSREVLETTLKELKAAETIDPQSIVVHGLVTDVAGRPVGGANIDIVGKWVRINYDTTRLDGTFTMIVNPEYGLQPPSSLRGRLRVRPTGGGDRFESHAITLNAGDPVVVLVRRTMLEQYDILYAIAALVAMTFLAYDARRVYRHVKRRRRPPATCPACGYDLRGSTTDRCSECGAVIPEAVGEEIRTIR